MRHVMTEGGPCHVSGFLDIVVQRRASDAVKLGDLAWTRHRVCAVAAWGPDFRRLCIGTAGGLFVIPVCGDDLALQGKAATIL